MYQAGKLQGKKGWLGGERIRLPRNPLQIQCRLKSVACPTSCRMSYLLRKYSISIAYSKSVHCNNKGDYPTGLNPQYEHNEPGMPTPKSYYTGKSLTAVRKRCIQWPQSNVESHTKLHPFL